MDLNPDPALRPVPIVEFGIGTEIRVFRSTEFLRMHVPTAALHSPFSLMTLLHEAGHVLIDQAWYLYQVHKRQADMAHGSEWLQESTAVAEPSLRFVAEEIADEFSDSAHRANMVSYLTSGLNDAWADILWYGHLRSWLKESLPDMEALNQGASDAFLRQAIMCIRIGYVQESEPTRASFEVDAVAVHLRAALLSALATSANSQERGVDPRRWFADVLQGANDQISRWADAAKATSTDPTPSTCTMDGVLTLAKKEDESCQSNEPPPLHFHLKKLHAALGHALERLHQGLTAGETEHLRFHQFIAEQALGMPDAFWSGCDKKPSLSANHSAAFHMKEDLTCLASICKHTFEHANFAWDLTFQHMGRAEIGQGQLHFQDPEVRADYHNRRIQWLHEALQAAQVLHARHVAHYLRYRRYFRRFRPPQQHCPKVEISMNAGAKRCVRIKAISVRAIDIDVTDDPVTDWPAEAGTEVSWRIVNSGGDPQNGDDGRPIEDTFKGRLAFRRDETLNRWYIDINPRPPVLCDSCDRKSFGKDAQRMCEESASGGFSDPSFRKLLAAVGSALRPAPASLNTGGKA